VKKKKKKKKKKSGGLTEVLGGAPGARLAALAQREAALPAQEAPHPGAVSGGAGAGQPLSSPPGPGGVFAA